VEAAVASGASAAEAAAGAADGTDPPTDTQADAAYREHLARVLTARALEAAGA
jgi:carbon-monoxide dehydrogenase medium subunit